VATKAYLESKDIQSLEKEATNMRDRLLIRMLFHLGCRVSEALALTADDIDFDRGTATILHLKERVRLHCPGCGVRLSRTHGFCPGCGSKVEAAIKKQLEHRRQRMLPVDIETLQMLKQYIRRGGPVNRNGLLLIFGINRNRAWQIVKDCASRAGLPRLVNPETGKVHNVSPHRLRDAFAIHAMKVNDTGNGLRMLQEHLGHQSFNTTARYRKVAGEELKEWYDSLWSQQNDR
jgi:integrase/recombinase XerD